MGVVIASGGYPEKYEKNQVIDLFELSGVKLFHAGTKYINDKLLTNGGRVFSLNAKADDLITCKKIIYSNIENIKFINKENLLNKFGNPSFIDPISNKYFYYSEKEQKKSIFAKKKY